MTAPTSAETGPLVDTHAHLQEPVLLDSLGDVLARARGVGVRQVIAVGTTAEDSLTVAGIARANPGIYAAVGIQPNYAAQAGSGDWERVTTLAEREEVVALGETGLDRYWDYTPFDVQQAWFERHLVLARERGLPVIIHCRDCETDIAEQLARLGSPVNGVLHSFTGTWEHAEAFLELGLHLSFAGMVTFSNRKLDPLRDVAARMPLDRLLVETDSPYLSPHPHRGKTNEPGRVIFTAGKISELRGMAAAELARVTTANARRLFRLPADEPL
jgi:TatD DNase family protein